MRKYLLPSFLGICLLIIKMTMSSNSTGITGQSSAGCTCHGSSTSATVISVTGFPTNYVNNQAYPITFTITNATKLAGGFDLAVTAGTISGAVSGQTALVSGAKEIYHTAAKSMTSGVVSWTFTWTAPASGSTAVSVTYAGNAVNLANGSSGDAWNSGSITVNGTVTPLSVTASSGSIFCNGGTATIGCTGAGGTPPYQFAKNGGTYQTGTTFAGNTAGTYTINVKDATNATASTVKTINQPTAIAITPSQTNVSCNGGTSGNASVSVTGGVPSYTYSWSPTGGTGATAFALGAGNYTCTVTDANGCTKTQSFTITQPAAISATPSQTNILCQGLASGSAGVAVSGGTPTYTYSWSPSGGTGSTAINLLAGNYTCTITDANSCQKLQTFSITQPSAIAITPSQTNVSCPSGSNATASVSVSGGVSSYTYSWSPAGGTGSLASNLNAGNYTCTVTDANLCTKTQSFSITQPSPISLAISKNDVTCFGGNNGSASATASGGVPSYTYSWAPSGGSQANALSLHAGTYTCTVTDASSCVASSSITITQPALINVTANLLNNASCNGTSVSLFGDVPSGNLGYTYTWTGGVTNGNPFFLTAPATYTVTGTSSITGCSDTGVISVVPVASNNLAQSSASNSVSVPGTTCATNTQLLGVVEKHTTASCQLIASIEQTVSATPLGSVNSCVTVLGSVPVFNTQPYVPRYYTITPQTQGQANVTLYFTHSELAAYNNYIISNNSSFPLLNYPNTVPQNGDQITNASITKINGTLNAGTGFAFPIVLIYDASQGVWKTTFTISSFSSFYLHATNPLNTPLSVNLISFKGIEKERAHWLYWTVNNESEVESYEVEYSTDGKHFEAIGDVAAQNIASTELTYEFVHTAIQGGHNYYRLRTKDITGTYRVISAVIDIQNGNRTVDAELQLYPNPLQGNLLAFTYNTMYKGKVTFDVCDVSGRVLWHEEEKLQSSLHNKQVLLDQLTSGMYWLKVFEGNKQVIVKPFTIH